MIRYQRFASIIAITGLLLGNLSGWMHVHHHAEVGPGEDAPVVTELVPGACHHDGCCSAAKSMAAENQGADSHSHGDEPASPSDHDSEHCAVCQLLFTVRDGGTIVIAPASVDIEAVPSLIAPPASDEVFADFITGAHLSRGPPVV